MVRAQLEYQAVSVLFNEPKLLKLPYPGIHVDFGLSFSALQRAEIAEMQTRPARASDR